MKVLLLGGTDVTISAGEALMELAPSIELVGVAYLEREFNISYSPTTVASSRYRDIRSWALARDIPALPYGGAQNDSRLIEFARDRAADLALVAGWYYFVPKKVRDAFTKGCIALHASLLPVLRGGAPLSWAILNGESRTGVTLFELVDEIDAGDIVAQESFALDDGIYVDALIEKTHDATRRLLHEALPALAAGKLPRAAQSGTPSYGLMREPADGEIDWREPATQIERLVRASSRPYTGAFTFLYEDEIRIWRATAVSQPPVFGRPGQIARVPEHPNHPIVVTGEACLLIQEAEANDGSAMETLMRSNHRHLGRRFGSV